MLYDINTPKFRMNKIHDQPSRYIYIMFGIFIFFTRTDTYNTSVAGNKWIRKINCMLIYDAISLK